MLMLSVSPLNDFKTSVAYQTHRLTSLKLTGQEVSFEKEV